MYSDAPRMTFQEDFTGDEVNFGIACPYMGLELRILKSFTFTMVEKDLQILCAQMRLERLILKAFPSTMVGKIEFKNYSKYILILKEFTSTLLSFALEEMLLQKIDYLRQKSIQSMRFDTFLSISIEIHRFAYPILSFV